MIEFGNALKAAREAKGLTVPQLADQTHMLASVIEGLENENFTKIAAPIYGRGFVKLYCEAVGLEPKPFVDEFMEIFNGNRESVIRERPVPPPSAGGAALPTAQTAGKTPEETPTAPVAAEPPLRNPQMGLFDPPEPPPPVRVPLSEAVSQPYADQPEKPNENVPDEESPAFSRYATPLHSRYEKPAIAWPIVLRWALIALAAAVFLTLVILGLKALYRATATPEDPARALIDRAPPAPVVKVPAAPSVKKATPAATSRAPVKIPDLYVD